MTALLCFLLGFYIVANRGWLHDVYQNRYRFAFQARQWSRLFIKHAVAWVRRMCDYDSVFIGLCAACVALAVWGVSWFMP